MIEPLAPKPGRFALLATLVALAPPAAQGAAQADSRVQRVEQGLRAPVAVAGETRPLMVLAERMSFYKVPGVSIAVIEKGRIAWTKGYGKARDGAPVTPDTRFSTGSISKPVSAIAALRRVDAGALTLDGDVNRLLKGWKVPASPVSAGEPVTLRRLLSHGAGLSVHGFYPGYEPGKPLPTNIQILNGQPPAMNQAVLIEVKPGSQWKYSGGGYQVVQQLLAEERRKDFPRLMRDLIFSPLKMRRSSFEQLPWSRAPSSNATAHDREGKELPQKWMLLPEMAAAGLWSTSPDLARFAIALQQAWHGRRGSIIGRATARQLFTRQAGEWGLGFELQGQGPALRFRHYGDNPGYKAVILAYPGTGQGAVILTNGDRGFRLIEEILLAVADVYKWPGYGPKIKSAVRVEAAALARLEGSYRLDSLANVRLVIERRGEGLAMRLIQPAGESEAELLAAGPDRFFRRDIDFELHFAEGSPAPKLVLHQDGQIFPATREAPSR